MLNSSLRCCIIKILVNIRMFSHLKQGVLNRFFYRFFFLFGFFLQLCLHLNSSRNVLKRVFCCFFAFNLLAVVNTMHMYGMCTGVCVCLCVGVYAIYIFICMYITHTGMRKILFIHVLVCWYLLLSPPPPCSSCFLSLFFFGVCNQPFYMPRLRFIRPHRHSINNNARRRSRCCCCCSIFCCFNGMPLNNFIKCFV